MNVVDSPFIENSKNFFFSREALLLGKRWPKNVGKMGNSRDIYCYANQ